MRRRKMHGLGSTFTQHFKQAEKSGKKALSVIEEAQAYLKGAQSGTKDKRAACELALGTYAAGLIHYGKFSAHNEEAEDLLEEVQDRLYTESEKFEEALHKTCFIGKKPPAYGDRLDGMRKRRR
jgi:hypothetical protein